MANIHQIDGIRGSRAKLKPAKKLRTKRRSREDVQIRYVNPEGKVVNHDNLKDFCRSMIFDDEAPAPWTEMAEKTGKSKDDRLSPGTISRLFYGDTQRPMLRTAVKVMSIYGYKMRITRDQ